MKNYNSSKTGSFLLRIFMKKLIRSLWRIVEFNQEIYQNWCTLGILSLSTCWNMCKDGKFRSKAVQNKYNVSDWELVARNESTVLDRIERKDRKMSKPLSNFWQSQSIKLPAEAAKSRTFPIKKAPSTKNLSTESLMGGLFPVIMERDKVGQLKLVKTIGTSLLLRCLKPLMRTNNVYILNR